MIEPRSEFFVTVAVIGGWATVSVIGNVAVAVFVKVTVNRLDCRIEHHRCGCCRGLSCSNLRLSTLKRS